MGYFLPALLLFVFIAIGIGIFRSCVEAGGFRKNDLVSFRAKSGMVGSFFIFSGSIGNKSFYRYLSKTDSGAIIQRDVPVDRAYIFEIEGAPYIERKLFLDGNTSYVNFHIPKGSIVDEFELDISQ